MPSTRRAASAALLGILAIVLSGCAGGAADSPPTPSAITVAVPTGARAYFFGDSWTEGYSAAAGKGYAEVAGKKLGWKVQIGPDGSGTGYVHVNTAGAPTFPQRAASLPARIGADVVILQGSINDEPGPLSDLDDSVTKTVELLRKKTDNAPIIMFGPAPATSPVPSSLYQIDAQLAADAQRLHIPYVSPLAENWITANNVKTVIDAGTGHPDTAGHAYIASRFVTDVRRILTKE